MKRKRNRKRYSYVNKAIRTQIGIGATYHIPYRLVGSAPSNASNATSGVLRGMGTTTGLMSHVPTLQLTRGMFKELKKL